MPRECLIAHRYHQGTLGAANIGSQQSRRKIAMDASASLWRNHAQKWLFLQPQRAFDPYLIQRI
jgi:hypothetical protein